MHTSLGAVEEEGGAKPCSGEPPPGSRHGNQRVYLQSTGVFILPPSSGDLGLLSLFFSATRELRDRFVVTSPGNLVPGLSVQ